MPQSFHRANCQNSDFRGQFLEGADFSYADIRGADFSEAVLFGANFSRAKTGLSPLWVIALIAVILLLSILSGLISGYAAALVADLITVSSAGRNLFGVIVAVLLVLYGFIVVRKGLGGALITFLEVVVAGLVAAIAFFPEHETGMALVVGANFSILALGGTLAGMGHVAVAIALAGTMELPKPKFWVITLAVFGLILGVLFGIRENELGYLIAGLIGLGNILLGLFVGRKALINDPKYRLIFTACIVLSTQKGTCFRGANLTDANFSQTTLRSTDLRQAILTRINWFKSKYLNQARVDKGTYLENDRVRQLLIHRDANGQVFDGLNLQGLNLQSAHLQNASFIGTNLSGTNLESADLTGAKLAKTQLYQANLKGAILTGAYIQDWGISPMTYLDQVICDYIYMQLPTPVDPDPCRKPDNKKENFKPGDFSAFISPIIKTLDLYQQQNFDPRRIATAYKTIDLFHYEGIDPSAVAIALKQLAEKFPEAGLEVISLEGRGEEQIRLQAKVTGQADRSRISSEYFEKYREAIDLPFRDLQSLLTAMSEKDKHIRRLENMVNSAVKSDKFYFETNYNLNSPATSPQPVRKILILTANPQNNDQRRLDAEVREIQNGLARAKQRDQFEIIAKWAVRTEDLRRALLDYNPQIVQFSGYGLATEGLALENEAGQMQLVSTPALASLFELFKDKVECVFLNACYSAAQAGAISQHIPYVIGMSHVIGERAALEFAIGFYDALGAGRSIDDAFKLGCVSIDLEGLPETLTPTLKKRASAHPDAVPEKPV
ncbi:MAG: pentapeptide repeat-containing protein [Cyanobacteria bacterium J06650_10]